MKDILKNQAVIPSSQSREEVSTANHKPPFTQSIEQIKEAKHFVLPKSTSREPVLTHAYPTS